MDSKIRLVACAFNNCLFDTMRASHKAYEGALKQKGIAYPQNLYVYDGDGVDTADVVHMLLAEAKATWINTYIIADVSRAKKEIYRQSYKDVALNTDLLETLKSYPETVKKCIVSSSPRVVIEELLEYHNIHDFFDFIVAQEDVQHQKPSAEPYYYAAKKIRTTPNRVLVYEGGNNGVTSAVRAGCEVVDIRNKKLKEELIR